MPVLIFVALISLLTPVAAPPAPSFSAPVGLNTAGGLSTGGNFSNRSLLSGEGGATVSGGVFSESPVLFTPAGDFTPTVWAFQ